MEGLRQAFDTIILCLKRHQVVKDVRRLILMMFISNEFEVLHFANCVGPTYSALTSIVFGACFPEQYIPLIAKEYRQRPNKSVDTLLLTRAGTDFIANSGVLGELILPTNHPSENLGIIYRCLYASVMSEYIMDRHLLTQKYPDHILMDENLVKLFQGTENVVVHMFEGQPYLERRAGLHIIREVMVLEESVRFTTPQMANGIGAIMKYFKDLKELQFKATNEKYEKYKIK
jgi:hypothetical protein